MNPTSRSRALKDSTFFERLSDKVHQDILSACASETWQKGRSILSRDNSETIYFVVSGHVKSVRINVETGRTVTLFLFGPGDMFDIQNLLGQACDETVFEAYSDAALLAVPLSDVRQWMADYPEFNRSILPYLGRMIGHLENMATGLALYDTETRLAHLILRHLDANGHNGIHLIKDMSHDNLAQMIGSVRTVVNRQLQHWRQAGIIATDNGRITVKRLEILLKKAESHMPWVEHQKSPK